MGVSLRPGDEDVVSRVAHSVSLRPTKSRLVKSKEKVMLIAFFDIDGVVHHEFSPPGQTVNGNFYV